MYNEPNYKYWHYLKCMATLNNIVVPLITIAQILSFYIFGAFYVWGDGTFLLKVDGAQECHKLLEVCPYCPLASHVSSELSTFGQRGKNAFTPLKLENNHFEAPPLVIYSPYKFQAGKNCIHFWALYKFTSNKVPYD